MPTNTDQPVLVGTDGSAAATEAVRWAAADAARRQAPLHIVYAIAAPIDFGPAIAFNHIDYEPFRHQGESAVAEARESARAAAALVDDLDISTFVVEAPPIPVLRDRSKDAALLVVGTRGLGVFRRGLLGSVSTALARHAHCPVAVIPDRQVRPSGWGSGPIVVGVDDSPGSRRALDIAFAEAYQRGVALRAVLTWSEFDRYIARTEMQKEAEAILTDSLAEHVRAYPEVRVEPDVVEERAAKRLLEVAETAQLLIVGSHGRGGFAGMTLGSVSQAVLHAADCPVIIARPPN